MPGDLAQRQTKLAGQDAHILTRSEGGVDDLDL